MEQPQSPAAASVAAMPSSAVSSSISIVAAPTDVTAADDSQVNRDGDDDEITDGNELADEAAVMARTMGFSSFGDIPRPPRKRKLSSGPSPSLAASAPGPGLGSMPPDQETHSALPAGLPQRPAPGTAFVGVPCPETTAGRRPRTRPGFDGSSDFWTEGCYDPLSNENPWSRLELQLGLSPLGSWPPSPAKQQSSAASGADEKA